MTVSSLLAISPLDGRYQEKLKTLRPIFSEFGLIRFRVLIEVRWLQFLANKANLPELSKLSPTAQKVLDDLVETFNEQDANHVKEIESTINHDVKAIEYFLKERMANNAELMKVSEFIHFGCTSEDINNLAYALMLQTARQHILFPLLQELVDSLKKMASQYADQPLLARTHGQPATPTSIGKEIANVIARLQRQMDGFSRAIILGKLNGASGNYNALSVTYPDKEWQKLSKQFIEELGLQWNAYTTQIEPHDYMAEYFHNLMRINTVLLDFDRDMWGYIALNYFIQKPNKNEVGSSVMPHKINPIDFENSEGNLGIANALLEHMAAKLPISRWQRDLSDSTVLRNCGVALAHSVLAYQGTLKGLSKLSVNTEQLKKELEDHWEILAEPIQTVLRRYGIEEPYEKLKSLTRGQKITKASLHEFINSLKLPDAVKEELCALTPSTYLGYAKDLAKKI